MAKKKFEDEDNDGDVEDTEESDDGDEEDKWGSYDEDSD